MGRKAQGSDWLRMDNSDGDLRTCFVPVVVVVAGETKLRVNRNVNYQK